MYGRLRRNGLVSSQTSFHKKSVCEAMVGLQHSVHIYTFLVMSAAFCVVRVWLVHASCDRLDLQKYSKEYGDVLFSSKSSVCTLLATQKPACVHCYDSVLSLFTMTTFIQRSLVIVFITFCNT